MIFNHASIDMMNLVVRNNMFRSHSDNGDEDILCSICEKPFTDEEWEECNEDEDGNYCHAHCCPECDK